MQELDNEIPSARENLAYITPDSVTNDPLDQKVLNCSYSVAAIASSGEFQDNGSCR